MKDPKEVAAAIATRQAETLRKAAASGSMNESFFGLYVAESLAAGEELSRSGLKAWLETKLRDDAFRPFVEAALRTIDAVPLASRLST